MDVKRWNLVLYEWIKATSLTDVTGSLDQVNLQEFFVKYHQRVSSNGDADIVEFLHSKFPDYEILMNDTNCISMQDYTYIFSLLLYHSCALKGNEFFLAACQKLEERQQLYIMKFFEFLNNEMDNGAKITKDVIRRGIKHSAQNIISPPPFMKVGSPLRTPTKVERSPPFKELSGMKLQEMNHLKAQLENEKFERNLLEVEVKQNQEQIERLVQRCKDLSRQVQILSNPMTTEKNDENFDPNRFNANVERIKAKMEKEISSREDKIYDLTADVNELTQCKQSLLEKINLIENERKVLLGKLCDFDESVCSLQAEITLKDEKIQYLEQSNEELLQILGEYKQKSKMDDSFLEFSSYHTVMSSAEGENLGGIIELQLKDKEAEIAVLKDTLEKSIVDKTAHEKIVIELQAKIESLENLRKEDDESTKLKFDSISRKMDIVKEKLKECMVENAEVTKREKELEDKLEREMAFNNKINQNNEILTSKLAEARKLKDELQIKYESTQEELKEVKKLCEQLKEELEQVTAKTEKLYEGKLEKLKTHMKALYEEHVAQRDRKYAALENRWLQETKENDQKVEEFNAKIKELTTTNEELVKENQFLTSKLKFNARVDDFDLGKISATSTPFDTEAPAIEDEVFNEMFMEKMKSGEMEIDDIRAASELQARNSKYPPHLRDSYAMQPLDRNMNEQEIKNTPPNVLIHRKKEGTNYRRPSAIPTPSKNARPSISSVKTLRDVTNDSVQPAKTPSKMKGFFGRISMGKDENGARLSIFKKK